MSDRELCSSEFSGNRCSLPKTHKGIHHADNEIWWERDVEPTYTRAELEKEIAKLAQTAKPTQTDREREATVVAAQICERSVEANREALRNIPDEEINCAIRSYHLNAIRIAETCAEQILASLPDLAAARAEMERRAKLELLNRYYDMTRDELIAAVFLDRDHILREAANSRPAKPTPAQAGRDGEDAPTP